MSNQPYAIQAETEPHSIKQQLFCAEILYPEIGKKFAPAAKDTQCYGCRQCCSPTPVGDHNRTEKIFCCTSPQTQLTLQVKSRIIYVLVFLPFARLAIMVKQFRTHFFLENNGCTYLWLIMILFNQKRKHLQIYLRFINGKIINNINREINLHSLYVVILLKITYRIKSYNHL